MESSPASARLRLACAARSGINSVPNMVPRSALRSGSQPDGRDGVGGANLNDLLCLHTEREQEQETAALDIDVPCSLRGGQSKPALLVVFRIQSLEHRVDAVAKFWSDVHYSSPVNEARSAVKSENTRSGSTSDFAMSSRVETPVSTSAVSMPALAPARISVSRRSPIMTQSVGSSPIVLADIWSVVGSGLPIMTGLTPEAV